jgi:hypothetical protein
MMLFGNLYGKPIPLLLRPILCEIFSPWDQSHVPLQISPI